MEEGLEAVARYHSDIELSGSIKSWMFKVVVIGAVCAGKSSVVKSLIARKPQPVLLADRTRGVDVHIEEPCQPDEFKRIQFVFWDFAGHNDYHSTHSLFLSSGALFLWVVDLARFVQYPSSRSESIHIWLDNVVCRTPGAVIQIVATHIDEPSTINNYETAEQELSEVVKDYWKAKVEGQELARKQCQREGEVPPVLRIVDKILPVSCEEGTNLVELREELSKLGVDGTTEKLPKYCQAGIRGRQVMGGKLFPRVGQTIPRIRVMASAVMNA